ncbi:hypothetical protein Bhyg_05710 [Pseudolycoriella hygida]|uniref:Plant Basic Secretory Protein n=1 Tax=Pseudolycoriella hygida TaxID=35572 RepID=A0A9Q0MZE6_9DIPT|nr:hypothetical protein Bhyg_05710 [Pseudolycoriella hygida]
MTLKRLTKHHLKLKLLKASRIIFLVAMKKVNFFTSLLILWSLSCTDAQTINVDTSQAPDLANFGSRVASELKQWYPKIRDILSSPNYSPPTTINIKFDKDYNGVAYASENQIVGSVNYYRKNQADAGSMVHEMVHVIQHYKKCPSWLTEGIADWIRYFVYEPDRKPKKPTPDQHYTNGYGVAAYFLQFIIDSPPKLQPNMIYWVNKDCREGTYADSIWKRLTGKTVDQHWNDMMNTKESGCYKNYCWSWCKSRGSGNWCYTTRGKKWDRGWVKCSSPDECNEYWECANECHPKDYT